MFLLSFAPFITYTYGRRVSIDALFVSTVFYVWMKANYPIDPIIQYENIHVLSLIFDFGRDSTRLDVCV